MRRAQIGDWSDMRLGGILGLIHRLIMLITFPIRRFWLLLIIFLAVCAVLLIIPLYFGANINEVKAWWQQILPQKQMIEAKNYAVEQITQGENAVKEFAANVVNGAQELLETEKYEVDEQGEIVVKSEKSAKPARKYPKWNVAQFGHAQYKPLPKKKLQTSEYGAKIEQTFAALKNALSQKLLKDERTAENIKENTKETSKPIIAWRQNQQNENVAEDAVQIDKPEVNLPEQKRIFNPDYTYTAEDFTVYYNFVDDRNLLYLRKPEIIYGRAEVNNANSLLINDRLLFLYGIYSSVLEYNLLAAQEYLQKIADENMVECVIVAYSAQTKAATALCFVGDVLLNKALVEQGFAENIALK